MPCSKCGAEKVHAKGLCQRCYQKTPERKAAQKTIQRKYDLKHPERIEKGLQKCHESMINNILDKHEEALKDDPNRLSKERIKEFMTRIVCDIDGSICIPNKEGFSNQCGDMVKDCIWAKKV